MHRDPIMHNTLAQVMEHGHSALQVLVFQMHLRFFEQVSSLHWSLHGHGPSLAFLTFPNVK